MNTLTQIYDGYFPNLRHEIHDMVLKSIKYLLLDFHSVQLPHFNERDSSDTVVNLVNEFKFQSPCYVKYRANIFGKSMKPLIPSRYGLNDTTNGLRMVSILNNS